MGGERRRERGKRKVGKGGDERYTKLYTKLCTKLYTKSKRQKRLYKWYYTINSLSHHQAVRPRWSIRLLYFYLFIVVVKGHMHICPKKRKEGRGHAGLESGKGGREREGRERGRGLGVDCSYIYMRDEFPSNLNKIAAKKHWVSCI